MKHNKLTPEEEDVIVYKATEPPFSGKYNDFFEKGLYACRRCGAELYESKNKFSSHCGWPSFDEEIPGRVRRMVDADGRRVEIVCANCGAHLGHVFEGEGYTAKNTRHCVNSISMKFIPQEESKKTEAAVFGGGCFWCTEAVFSRLEGVMKVTPGYAGGKTKKPSYEEVSGGKTGHAETVKIEYDPSVISFKDLLEVFFSVHDPTTANQQGNDVGEQYRSMILFTDNNQKKAAEEFIAKLIMEKAFKRQIVTEVRPLGEFHAAEDYHQRYYESHGHQPYCQLVISPKLAKVREKFGRLFREKRCR